MRQGQLFELSDLLPAGLVYRAEFISPDEEDALLAAIRDLPLKEAQYKEYTAKRRIISFGGTYDFSANELVPAGPIPHFLDPLRERISELTGIAASRFTHALIAEYRTGVQLGWHRDVPDFEVIAGLSLGGACRMRLRRYPPAAGKNRIIVLNLEPRSVYTMKGEARWGYQHSISPTKELRYSITFRTKRADRSEEPAAK